MSDQPSRVWTVVTWASVGVLVVAGAVAVVGGLVSPAILLDLVALWPLGALSLPLGAAAVIRRRGGRLPAAAPLMLVTWALVTVVLYAGRWSLLPSASLGWELAATDARAGSLHLTSSGMVTVGPGQLDTLVSVAPSLLGGDAGPPFGTSRETAAGVEVVVGERPEAGLATTKGWEVRIDPSLPWDLSVDADPVDLDLAGVPVSTVVVEGAGRIGLGAPTGRSSLTVDGDLVVVVPDGVAVEVYGEATVPTGWAPLGDGPGWRRPGTSPGWTITVLGGAASVEGAWPGPFPEETTALR